MICYRDRTWCSYYLKCLSGPTCDRALTPLVTLRANAIGLPVCKYVDKPTCFEERDERDTNESSGE